MIQVLNFNPHKRLTQLLDGKEIKAAAMIRFFALLDIDEEEVAFLLSNPAQYRSILLLLRSMLETSRKGFTPTIVRAGNVGKTNVLDTYLVVSSQRLYHAFKEWEEREELIRLACFDKVVKLPVRSFTDAAFPPPIDIARHRPVGTINVKTKLALAVVASTSMYIEQEDCSDSTIAVQPPRVPPSNLFMNLMKKGKIPTKD